MLFASTGPAASTGADADRFVSYELGHLVGSAVCGLRSERLAETCAPARWTVMDIQWEVAPRAPVQG